MMGIYKIINKVNGKIYIGQSVSIENRWSSHKSEFKKNKYDTKLYRAMHKYGLDNFELEVIEECAQSELDERETFWIAEYDSYANGYNETLGGQGLGYYMYDTQQIRQMWDDGLSIGDIMSILNCDKATVRSRLKEYKNYSIEESRRRGRNVKYHPERLPASRNKYFEMELK